MAKTVIQSIQGAGAQNPGYPGGVAAETAGVRTPWELHGLLAPQETPGVSPTFLPVSVKYRLGSSLPAVVLFDASSSYIHIYF